MGCGGLVELEAALEGDGSSSEVDVEVVVVIEKWMGSSLLSGLLGGDPVVMVVSMEWLREMRVSSAAA